MVSVEHSMDAQMTWFELSLASISGCGGPGHAFARCLLKPTPAEPAHEQVWLANGNVVAGYREIRLIVRAVDGDKCNVRAFLVGRHRGPLWVASESGPTRWNSTCNMMGS